MSSIHVAGSDSDPGCYEATKAVPKKAQKKIMRDLNPWPSLIQVQYCSAMQLKHCVWLDLLGVSQEWVQFIPVIWRVSLYHLHIISM